jgi:hypothetical protein
MLDKKTAVLLLLKNRSESQAQLQPVRVKIDESRANDESLYMNLCGTPRGLLLCHLAYETAAERGRVNLRRSDPAGSTNWRR